MVMTASPHPHEADAEDVAGGSPSSRWPRSRNVFATVAGFALVVLAVIGYAVAVSHARDKVDRYRAAASWFADDKSGVAWLVGMSGERPAYVCDRGPAQISCLHEGVSRYTAVVEPGPLDEAFARSGLDLGEGIVLLYDPVRWTCDQASAGARPDDVGFGCRKL